jgi:3-methyl-2-oxobutanoate hydroxymethyltransferase
VILECVPDLVSKIVTERLNVPTISYGAGVHCDGQGLVSPDVLGLFDRFLPKFAKRYVNLGELILTAFQSYKDEVEKGEFPDAAHSYHVDEDVVRKLREGTL